VIGKNIRGRNTRTINCFSRPYSEKTKKTIPIAFMAQILLTAHSAQGEIGVGGQRLI
jgi:hypothetical protein